jgi:uncharacterized membrane protein HdeD (DUF308 family)
MDPSRDDTEDDFPPAVEPVPAAARRWLARVAVGVALASLGLALLVKYLVTGDAIASPLGWFLLPLTIAIALGPLWSHRDGPTDQGRH